ncbi:hypothetical protein GCM10023340_00110 [Nocardioides marinquilinus]|uniref:Sulfotransferase family protein n=1 Tax=Nocardioides marinquilinus TaxID=1210400 RepID=A0ABP9P3X5_9ACTN
MDDGRRVVLHVGAPKSGTTHLQSRLNRNADALAAHGVLVPRAPADDGPASLAFRAALDLTGVRLGRPRRYTDGWWPRLVEAVTTHDGTSVVSDEALVRCTDATAARAVRDLAAGGAEVHVVYTARDLARQLVSGWLEGLKHGQSLTYGDYLARARDGGLKPLRTYDLPTVLARWAGVLGHPERVHLVTVPPAGADRDLLWQRFTAAAGLDPAWAPRPARRSNDAVGLPEAQFLRALNERLGDDARRGGRWHATVRDVVVGRGLAGRDSPRVRLDPAHHGWVAALTATWLAQVRASGVDVVGDLADLEPVRTDAADWVDPDRVVPAAVGAADAALGALAALAAPSGEPVGPPAYDR